MKPIRILAVDDQISSLLALEDILGAIDAQFIKATSAKEALIIMLERSVDCILLDVSMPEMDGFQFLQTLRNAPSHASIPVIMITGKIFSENETLMAYKFGAVDFLLKPIAPETVYRKVSFIVQQAKRIKSIKNIEHHLRKLETDVINPLHQFQEGEVVEKQKELNLIIRSLIELNSDWKKLKQ